MYIQEKNKEKFYYRISNMTPKQFEILLREQYKESHIIVNTYDRAENGGFYPTPIPKADKIIPAVPLN
ncbi:hypothetical protein ACH0B5_10540 [Ureibacillus sp. 179-F W5.1 NHS]|uniref:Uncharacterized protein n=1 Tax=Lysinibacillus halotolerans TaxID=1368476 RepID=A0A3M8H4B7_9BACI|nr:hypothetical protein [Lysinibacillus halotolerans]RNC97286.1 hypothetical protein EC501_16090 [Lysinibacillus halotolerans]